MDIVPILTAGLTTLGTLGITILASRRFGLPGLAREVTAEQNRLITALRDSTEQLRTQNEQLREQNELLSVENHNLRVRLAVAYDDIASLYRGQGRKVPAHVKETQEAFLEEAKP